MGEPSTPRRPPGHVEGDPENGKTPARSGSRDLLVLLTCGLIVVAGAAAAQHATPPAPKPPASGAELLPALPSGAPPRGLEELPADDERAAGCHFVDRGFGDYGGWKRLAVTLGHSGSIARALIPAGRAVDADGSFRLLVHFHGAEPVRRALAPEGFDLVIAAVDAGVGSQAYDRALADPATFGQLVAAVEAEVAAEDHLPAARAKSIVISSWSAGYGAVAHLMPHGDPRIEAVILLDSLYAGYTDTARHVLDRARIAPFLDAVRAARAGGPAFFLTHTAIATPGYGSTGEVASFLLAELGASAAQVDEEPSASSAYPLRRLFEDGHLWIRGYAGADRDAHCAQLHLLPTILRDTILPVLR